MERHLLTGRSPGNYHFVLFDQLCCRHVVSVMDILTVRKDTNLKLLNVSMINQTYHPHQSIIFDTAADGVTSQLVE
jgi:hypothetical protein